MKRNFIALAILAVFATASFANGTVTITPTNPGVNSYSEVNVQSYSSFGTNQASSHFATANAENTTSANTTSGKIGVFNAYGTTATTAGTTLTTAGGIGNGYAGADANQYGSAKVIYNDPTMSTVGAHTFSVAEVQNTGAAVSSSLGGATNLSLGASVFGHSIAQSTGLDAGAGVGTKVGGGSYSTGGNTYQAGNAKAGNSTPFLAQ